MKTKNLFFAVLAMLITSAVFATETPKFKITPKGDGKILVLFESENALPMEVTISDEYGNQAYKWKSESPETSLKKLFNLSELEKGNYNFVVKSGNRKLSTSLNLKKENIKVGPTVQITEPYFNFRNNMLYITYLNVPKQNVYVNIYKNGNHYTGFNLGNEFDLQKCINFCTAESGIYDIVLTGSSDSHLYTLTR
jgi:hypothetical protein